MLSIVLPIHNQETALLRLYDRVTTVLEKLNQPYEMVFVDDASTDRSFDLLCNLVEIDSHLKVVRLRRRFGQSSALAAGFDEAHGGVVVSLNGDVERNPDVIPLLIEKLEEGYDIVTEQEGSAGGTKGAGPLFAHGLNWLVKRVTGGNISEFDATWCAYRAGILKDVNLDSELHRFTPLLAHFYGARMAGVSVPADCPQSGGSLYGGISLVTFFDVLTNRLLLSYAARPMHSVGRWGIACALLGGILVGTLAVQKLILDQDILRGHTLVLLATAALWFAGLMLFCVGLIGEVWMRAYFESQGRRIYSVREVKTRRERVVDGAR